VLDDVSAGLLVPLARLSWRHFEGEVKACWISTIWPTSLKPIATQPGGRVASRALGPVDTQHPL